MPADRGQVGVPVRWFRQAQPTLGCGCFSAYGPWSRLTTRFARCSTTCGYGEWSRLFARCSTTWLSPSPRWLRSERQRASRNHSTSRARGPESGRRTGALVSTSSTDVGVRLLLGVRPWSRLTARFARCSTTCGYGPWSRLSARFARCSTTCGYGHWSRLTARFARCSTTWLSSSPRWLRSERQRASRNHSTSRAMDRSQVGVPVRWFRQAQPTLGSGCFSAYGPWSRLSARFARCSTTCGYGPWSRLSARFARCSTTCGYGHWSRLTARFARCSTTCGYGHWSRLSARFARFETLASARSSTQGCSTTLGYRSVLLRTAGSSDRLAQASPGRRTSGSSRARCGLGWCP